MSDVSLGRDGPNRIHWVLCIGGEVAEGLAVVEPCLSDLLTDVGVIRCEEVIRFGETPVAFGTEFFPWLGIDKFFELGLKLFLWGFFVTIGEFN